MTIHRPDTRRARALGAAAAVVGFAGFAIGVWLEPRRAFFAYLAAWSYTLSLALGALCLVMIAHTTGARWFVVVRRVAETVSGTIPVLGLLFLPLLAGLTELYPWARSPDALGAAERAAILHRHLYLNAPFFLVRSIAYLCVWSALAIALRRASVRQDTGGASSGPSPVVLSGVGLFVFGFTITFAAFDWLMSLSVQFSSTVFGVYFFAGGMVSALALMAVLAWALERAGVLRGKLAASHVHALGRLLLTFLVFWAYVAYAQGFLVWIADIPREVHWYLERWERGWKIVLALLIVGHFAIPFFALLSRPLKRSFRAMAALGAWLLLMHYVDVFWLVIPSLADDAARFSWLDAAALLAVGGSVVAFAAHQLADVAPYPIRDPDLDASLAYESR